MKDQIIVTPYDPEWVHEFNEIGSRIRQVLGDIAIRIDHIGSTAVTGLAAKPIIDVQISVRSLEPVNQYRSQMESIGYVYREETRKEQNDILEKVLKEGELIYM